MGTPYAGPAPTGRRPGADDGSELLLLGTPGRDEACTRPVLARVDRRGLLQSGRGGRLADLARLDVSVAAGLGGDEPHHAVVGEGTQCVGEQLEEVAVPVAVPEQHR